MRYVVVFSFAVLAVLAVLVLMLRKPHPIASAAAAPLPEGPRSQVPRIGTSTPIRFVHGQKPPPGVPVIIGRTLSPSDYPQSGETEPSPYENLSQSAEDRVKRFVSAANLGPEREAAFRRLLSDIGLQAIWLVQNTRDSAGWGDLEKDAYGRIRAQLTPAEYAAFRKTIGIFVLPVASTIAPFPVGTRAKNDPKFVWHDDEGRPQK